MNSTLKKSKLKPSTLKPTALHLDTPLFQQLPCRPDEVLIAKETDAALKPTLLKAIETLNEQESAVIRMHFLEGKKHGECARALNVSESRIQQIAYYGLRHLRHPVRSRYLTEFRG
jgi:RNA polymerase sigma factor (sigma-70 family)